MSQTGDNDSVHSGANEDSMRTLASWASKKSDFKSALDPNKKIRGSKLSRDAIQKNRIEKYRIQEEKLFNIFRERREDRRRFQARIKLLLKKEQWLIQRNSNVRMHRFWLQIQISNCSQGFTQQKVEVSWKTTFSNKKIPQNCQRISIILSGKRSNVEHFRQAYPIRHVVPLKFVGMFEKPLERKGKIDSSQCTKFKLDKHSAQNHFSEVNAQCSRWWKR